LLGDLPSDICAPIFRHYLHSKKKKRIPRVETMLVCLSVT